MTQDLIESQTHLPGQKASEQIKDFYEYTQKSKSENSRRAYKFGWERFLSWCKEQGYDVDDPKANPVLLVGMFLSAMAKDRKLKPSSLQTYLAGLKHYFWETKKIELDHPEIRRAMKGIRHDMRDIRKTKKEAILVEDLLEILKPMQGSMKPIDIRDKALLLLGFCGAFRRTELAGIYFEHIRFDKEGITILLPWSKTDQGGQGQAVQIPCGRHEDTCPISTLKAWLLAANIGHGAIFPSITRHGAISDRQMSDKAVALIIKKRAGDLFDKGDIAGHSLRRGLVTSALEAQVPDSVVMRQTRHRSVNMLKEYYQDLRNYKNNALRSLNL